MDGWMDSPGRADEGDVTASEGEKRELGKKDGGGKIRFCHQFFNGQIGGVS
jgi:hypothetical protein